MSGSAPDRPEPPPTVKTALITGVTGQDGSYLAELRVADAMLGCLPFQSYPDNRNGKDRHGKPDQLVEIQSVQKAGDGECLCY